MSSACQRYCGPLRLPGQPAATSAFALIRRGWTPVVHWPGSPVVPSGAVRACHPCYPGGPRVTWQRWWSPGHRSSPPVNGVDALTVVHEATPGFAARYGLRGCALPRSARQGTWCFGLPLTPPSSYPGALPAPGAGLPPASSRVSTACYRTPFSTQPLDSRRAWVHFVADPGGAGRSAPQTPDCRPPVASSSGGRGRRPPHRHSGPRGSGSARCRTLGYGLSAR